MDKTTELLLSLLTDKRLIAETILNALNAGQIDALQALHLAARLLG